MSANGCAWVCKFYSVVISMEGIYFVHHFGLTFLFSITFYSVGCHTKTVSLCSLSVRCLLIGLLLCVWLTSLQIAGASVFRPCSFSRFRMVFKWDGCLFFKSVPMFLLIYTECLSAY